MNSKTTISALARRPLHSLKPGLTIAEVAHIIGLKYQNARNWCITHGYKYQRYKSMSGLDQDQLIKFLKDHAADTLEYAATLLGVSRQRAHQLYKQYGIPRMKRPMTDYWGGNISGVDSTASVAQRS